MTQYTPAVYVKLPGAAKPRQLPKKKYSSWWLCLLVIPIVVLILVPLPFLTDIVLSSSSTMTQESREQASMPLDLSVSLNDFSVDMYRELAAKSPGENMFFSPLSVMSALGMTLLGCQSNTHAQLSSVLKINHGSQQVQNAFSKVIQKYKIESPEYEMRTANMMYVSDKLAIKQDYSNSLTTSFQATSRTVDFAGQTEAVRGEINSAVERETNSKIKDLIPAGVLNSLTRLVLVNAVYFKGLWATQFDEENTLDREFWTSETTNIKVPMMFVENKFKFTFLRDIKASMLAMDYKGSNLSMVIILPDAKEGLAAVEEKLHTVNIGSLLKTLNATKLQVYLPKFKLEFSADLKETLTKLGAEDLFTAGKADLSGIGSVPGDLYVSNVLHKAFVEVNEKGTEAAAATAAVMMTRMMLVDRFPPFNANRPFSFFIYDKELDMTLFAGRLVEPPASDKKVEL